VAQFAEKPSLEVANAYLAGGQHTWNSGMFVLRASTWLKALQHFRPDIAAATKTAWQGKTIDTPFVRPNKEAFTQVPSESVDYAVMEKCPSSSYPIHMVPLDAGWNDLGAWDAVWQVNQDGHQDAQGNVVQGDALLADTSNTFIHASSRLVGAVGVTLKFEGKGVDETATVVAIKGDKAPGLKVGDVVVKIDPRYFRPTEVETLLGDPSKAKAKLGWAGRQKLPCSKCALTWWPPTWRRHKSMHCYRSTAISST
jgi:hypothetical protein